VTERSFDVLIGVPSDCSGAFAGCERMPAALRAERIIQALDLRDEGNLQVVIGDPVREAKTGVIGLHDLLGLSRVVREGLTDIMANDHKPLVLGGDCTLLIGVAAALEQIHPDAGLLFVDGHLDCYDGRTSPTGEGADMELAILLGVGPEPLVNFGSRVPMLADDHVVVLGPSDEADAARLGAPDPRSFAPRMPIVTLEELELDPTGHARSAVQHLEAAARGFWLHLDLDVLSAHALPAVDYPDERGLSWQQLLELLVPVLAAPGLLGASVAILNPTRDAGGRSAARVVELLRDAVANARELAS
jgi:arginase